jgi:transposase
MLRMARFSSLMDAQCLRTMRSKIGPMKRVARMLRGHRPLILNWFRAKAQLSSGVVEGLQCQGQTHYQKGLRGRKLHCIITPGALPEPKFTHRFF